VEVALSLDQALREVDVPPALAGALDAHPPARAAYDRLAFTHRKEFARWMAEVKKDETRDRRVAEGLEMIREGRTRS